MSDAARLRTGNHPCHCGKPGHFGWRCSARHDILGTWFCLDHAVDLFPHLAARDELDRDKAAK
jgi:hypothetical protein